MKDSDNASLPCTVGASSGSRGATKQPPGRRSYDSYRPGPDPSHGPRTSDTLLRPRIAFPEQQHDRHSDLIANATNPAWTMDPGKRPRTGSAYEESPTKLQRIDTNVLTNGSMEPISAISKARDSAASSRPQSPRTTTNGSPELQVDSLIEQLVSLITSKIEMGWSEDKLQRANNKVNSVKDKLASYPALHEERITDQEAAQAVFDAIRDKNQRLHAQVQKLADAFVDKLSSPQDSPTVAVLKKENDNMKRENESMKSDLKGLRDTMQKLDKRVTDDQENRVKETDHLRNENQRLIDNAIDENRKIVDNAIETAAFNNKKAIDKAVNKSVDEATIELHDANKQLVEGQQRFEIMVNSLRQDIESKDKIIQNKRAELSSMCDSAKRDNQKTQETLSPQLNRIRKLEEHLRDSASTSKEMEDIKNQLATLQSKWLEAEKALEHRLSVLEGQMVERTAELHLHRGSETHTNGVIDLQETRSDMNDLKQPVQDHLEQAPKQYLGGIDVVALAAKFDNSEDEHNSRLQKIEEDVNRLKRQARHTPGTATSGIAPIAVSQTMPTNFTLAHSVARLEDAHSRLDDLVQVTELIQNRITESVTEISNTTEEQRGEISKRVDLLAEKLKSIETTVDEDRGGHKARTEMVETNAKNMIEDRAQRINENLDTRIDEKLDTLRSQTVQMNAPMHAWDRHPVQSPGGQPNQLLPFAQRVAPALPMAAARQIAPSPPPSMAPPHRAASGPVVSPASANMGPLVSTQRQNLHPGPQSGGAIQNINGTTHLVIPVQELLELRSGIHNLARRVDGVEYKVNLHRNELGAVETKFVEHDTKFQQHDSDLDLLRADLIKATTIVSGISEEVTEAKTTATKATKACEAAELATENIVNVMDTVKDCKADVEDLKQGLLKDNAAINDILARLAKHGDSVAEGSNLSALEEDIKACCESYKGLSQYSLKGIGAIKARINSLEKAIGTSVTDWAALIDQSTGGGAIKSGESSRTNNNGRRH